MYSLECEVLKDNGKVGGSDFNCIKFLALNNKKPISGVKMNFSANGKVALSILKGETNHNGECFVIARNSIAEDVSIKATVIDERFVDYQYGIVSFL